MSNIRSVKHIKLLLAVPTSGPGYIKAVPLLPNFVPAPYVSWTHSWPPDTPEYPKLTEGGSWLWFLTQEGGSSRVISRARAASVGPLTWSLDHHITEWCNSTHQHHSRCLLQSLSYELAPNPINSISWCYHLNIPPFLTLQCHCAFPDRGLAIPMFLHQLSTTPPSLALERPGFCVIEHLVPRVSTILVMRSQPWPTNIDEKNSRNEQFLSFDVHTILRMVIKCRSVPLRLDYKSSNAGDLEKPERKEQKWQTARLPNLIKKGEHMPGLLRSSEQQETPSAWVM